MHVGRVAMVGALLLCHADRLHAKFPAFEVGAPHPPGWSGRDLHCRGIGEDAAGGCFEAFATVAHSAPVVTLVSATWENEDIRTETRCGMPLP